MDAVLRILRWAIVVGAVGFILGFFGPMILAPDSNQGPLLGILITGPLGAIAGAAYGIWHELRGTGAAAAESSAGWMRPAFRGSAMFLSAILLINGIPVIMLGAVPAGIVMVVLGLLAGWWGWTGWRQ